MMTAAGGICGLALGSNQGDRLQCLRLGVRQLLERVPTARVVAVAPLYESEPVDCTEDAGAFLNTVLELESPLPPTELRRLTAEVELSLGRLQPGERRRNAPRPLDLDLLYFDDLAMNTDELVLPHPRMWERAFVLQPLAMIRPHLHLPGQEKTILQALQGLPQESQTLRQVMDSTWLDGSYAC
jgi:2-amino-4-hydroxy-6-hydroxymethyldihydropteridine diphosphokinase